MFFLTLEHKKSKNEIRHRNTGRRREEWIWREAKREGKNMSSMNEYLLTRWLRTWRVFTEIIETAVHERVRWLGSNDRVNFTIFFWYCCIRDFLAEDTSILLQLIQYYEHSILPSRLHYSYIENHSMAYDYCSSQSAKIQERHTAGESCAYAERCGRERSQEPLASFTQRCQTENQHHPIA